MIRAVIDTNGLVGSMTKQGPTRWLYDEFIEGRFVWVFGNEILTEYVEVIADRYTSRLADLMAQTLLLAENTERFEASYRWGIVYQDPDDNKFVDCAAGAGVDYLVTSDRHMLGLKRQKKLFPSVPIVNFEQFRRILLTKI